MSSLAAAGASNNNNTDAENNGLANVQPAAIASGAPVYMQPSYPRPPANAAAPGLTGLKIAIDTAKRNRRVEYNQADLLRLLCFLEGELQAREVVIAALKSDHLKHHIYALHSSSTGGGNLDAHDPSAAMFRDSLAMTGNLVTRCSSAKAAQAELVVRQLARTKLDALQTVIYEQRHAHVKLIGVLKDFEDKHKSLLQQLADEKKKYERDTAQGDDITYSLEVERQRLRADLECERTNARRLQAESKKVQETLDAERGRQKTIVLLLMAERKRIIMKYIEERKRSEDLAQILSEEKLRVDTISEGLEEESKKSLRMEAELEAQQQAFDVERKHYAATQAASELKIREQDQELNQLRYELQRLKQLQQHDGLATQPRRQLPQLDAINRSTQESVSDDGSGPSAGGPLMSSVTKVVQPTATVSSVPVSGPTTGIARSISPGQSMRPGAAGAVPSSGDAGPTPYNSSTAIKVPRKLPNIAAMQQQSSVPASPPIPTSGPKYLGAGSSHISTIKKTPASLPLGRGVPPPIPPNKPIVPPKREPSITRMGSVTLPHGQQQMSAGAPGSMATGVAVATSGTADDII